MSIDRCRVERRFSRGRGAETARRVIGRRRRNSTWSRPYLGGQTRRRTRTDEPLSVGVFGGPVLLRRAPAEKNCAFTTPSQLSVDNAAGPYLKHALRKPAKSKTKQEMRKWVWRRAFYIRFAAEVTSGTIRLRSRPIRTLHSVHDSLTSARSGSNVASRGSGPHVEPHSGFSRSRTLCLPRTRRHHHGTEVGDNDTQLDLRP